MGLHRYGNAQDTYDEQGYYRQTGQNLERPSSASSFSSTGGASGSYQRQPQPQQDSHYGKRYNPGQQQQHDQQQQGSFGQRSSKFDSLQNDSRLMNANAGQLGLDPTAMPPIAKDFYQEDPAVASMTPAEVNAFRASAHMVISGAQVPRPVQSIEQAGFPEAVLRRWQRAGLEKPTPIQAQGWPMALSGQNMVGIAQTGSGKTLSFVLPALVHIQANASSSSSSAAATSLANGAEGTPSPVALVLAPTRELAVQIQEVSRLYGNVVKLNSCCLYGGAPKRDQIRNLKLGCEIVVATPGRLLDLVEEGQVSLSRCSFVVLDEADRMLDMGFEPQLRRILALIRRDRQVLMWSATWPKGVQKLARDVLGAAYIQVKIGTSELHANKKITQNVIVTAEFDKRNHLDQVLAEAVSTSGGNQGQPPRTIIFCNKKRTVDYITDHLRNTKKYRVIAIHGDKEQRERDRAIAMLKDGRVNILVATDVAARGLDVPEVQLVINFDMPLDVENYVHRIGRTARGSSQSGISYALITEEDKPITGELVRIMEDAGQQIPDALRAMVPARRQNGPGGRHYGGSGGAGKHNARWYGQRNGGGGAAGYGGNHSHRKF